jgi:hypothetical protein
LPGGLSRNGNVIIVALPRDVAPAAGFGKEMDVEASFAASAVRL